MSGQREQLLEALRHALGARWVRVLRKDSPLPDSPARGGLFRRRETHHLTVDVRSTSVRVVCALPRLATLEDTLLAGAVARTLEPAAPAAQARGDGISSAALAALGSPPDRRPEEILDAAVQLTGASAGALAVSGDEATAWTKGPGKPVLRRAAVGAMSAGEGEVEVSERTFLSFPLRWADTVVGGLALEGARDSAELRAFTQAIAAVLFRPSPPSLDRQPRATTADMHTLFAAISLVMIAVDEQGHLVGASPEAENLFGFLADFDLGTDVRGRLRSPELEKAVFAGGELPAEIEIAERMLEPAIVALPSGIRVLVLHDRTHEERLERLQEDLVASVAHELRTPIAAVQGLVQLLKLRAGKLPADKLETLLSDGEREIARLERLVEDLLLAARVATGGIVAQADAIDLRPIADDIVGRISPRYGDRRFVVEGDAEAHADPSLIRHVVWHLVDNAAKFGPEGGEVRVEIRPGRDGAEVHVVDQGEGIFSGDIPTLFRRFRQLDASATRQHGGAGLGLFLVKAILDAQGGRVWVNSKLGKGSTFSFKLPPVPPDT